MSGEIIIRLGGYSEINIWEFCDWLQQTYFKIPSEDKLYKNRFDVDITISIDEDEKLLRASADLIDMEEIDNMSETLKREIREINRGGLQ